MKRQLIVLLWLLIASMPSVCQSVNDTVRLDIVSVFAKPNFFNDGAKRETIDSLTIQTSLSNNLSELLSHSSSLIVKNYGTEGMSSSISLRGGGATRTQVQWEGFPLNANSNGEQNLSIIPSNGFNFIAIDHSASATNFGSGTYGGAIELKTIPLFRKHANASFLASYGSFNTFKGSINVNAGNEYLQYSGVFFTTKSDSDFEYYDYVRLEDCKRKNAEYQKFGTIQNLHFKLSEHWLAHLGVWYQVNQSNLPALLGSNPNNAEKQTDSVFRAVFSLKMIYPKTKLTYKTSYIDDYELYTKKITPEATQYSTYSEILNRSNMHSLQLQQRISSKFYFSTELQGKIAIAEVGDYGGKKKENSIAGISALQYKNTNFAGNISIRKEWNSQYHIPFICNAGFDYALLAQKLQLRASVGNKYRTPTFNDLYWIAWGNPDLKPEYGFAGECGGEYTFISKDSAKLSSEITLFHSVINDMIMWEPQGAVWHPNNTAQAVLQGIEISTNITIAKQKYSIRNKFGVNFNNAHISKTYNNNSKEEVGHQLYYVPKSEVFFNPNFSFYNWNISLFAHYETKRYYSLTKTLDDYFLLDISVQKTLSFKNSKFVIGGKINNATNTVYEQIRSYPLPKRNYEISIQYFINS
ncbi:MAG: TonB-dependent receptor plug domain-containing protein [Bacteroidales bacterium]|nr:TonB-dependent receptor plug domain-containing protein [Bacteroidales bacterium]